MFKKSVAVRLVQMTEVQFFIHFEGVVFRIVQEPQEKEFFHPKILRQHIGQAVVKHLRRGLVLFHNGHQRLTIPAFPVEKGPHVRHKFFERDVQGHGKVSGFGMAQHFLKRAHPQQGRRIGAVFEVQEVEPQFFAQLEGLLNGGQRAVEQEAFAARHKNGAQVLQLGVLV